LVLEKKVNMKKTSDSEPRAKRPRISNTGSQKSGLGETKTGRTFRKSGDEKPDFKGRLRTSERETGATDSGIKKKSGSARSIDREPWKKDSKPRGADSGLWKKDSKSGRFNSGPWKTDGGPRKSFNKTKKTENETAVWDSESSEWVGTPTKNGIKSKSQGEKFVSGNLKAQGGSRTRNLRSRNRGNELETPVKQSREYKKVIRKPNDESHAKSTTQSSKSSEPWKKESNSRSSGSGPWRTEGGTRKPYIRSRKTEGDKGVPGNKSQGNKKDFRTAKGESRIFDSESMQTGKASSKSLNKPRKATGAPWNADGKTVKAKSKARAFGKGPGADAYSRSHKASNGPHKKKI
jgi:hypothetical protein